MDHHYLNEELIKATKNNHPDEMLRLIEAGADVNYKDEFGVAALHWATNHADSHTIEVLVEHGADVNVQNAQGMTKLMQMSSFGDASIVSYLLEHGADAGMKDFSGKDAVSYAKEAMDFGKDMPSERIGEHQEVIQMLEAQIAYDKLPEHCFWFALDDEKCISVWFAPDQDDGDQFQMKLEERAEDGSMGAHCELISDESYGTRDLSFGAVCKTLWEVCVDAGFSDDKSVSEVVSRVAKEIFANYGLEVPVVDCKKAIEIAEDFLKRMNPDGWDGVGKRPKSFDTRIVTYDVGSPYNDELDIRFEKEIHPDTGKKEWMHSCELRDKESGDVMIPMHGCGINSVQNLADTIWDICKDFALDKEMEIQERDCLQSGLLTGAKKPLMNQIQAAASYCASGIDSDFVRSVAHFAENENVQDGVLQSDRLRKQTLDVCQGIPGYSALPREDKNKLYDLIKKSILASQVKSVDKAPER